jgi:hypothetical protein
LSGLKHQKEKRIMDHFAGLDVSVKETSVCIVDDTGKIVREVKVASEPEALLARRTPPTVSNELDWKLDRCRNGCSARWLKRIYRWFALKRDICRRC